MSQFRRFLILLFVTGVISGLAGPATAQDAQPAVKIMLSGGDALAEDLEYLTLLAGEFGEEQWPMLEEYLETFLEGIDREKSVLRGHGVRFLPHDLTRLIVDSESNLMRHIRHRIAAVVGQSPLIIDILLDFGIQRCRHDHRCQHSTKP